MDFTRLMGMVAVLLWTETAVFGELQRQVVTRKEARPCRTKASANGAGSNITKVMIGRPKPCISGESVPTTVSQDLAAATTGERGSLDTQGANATETSTAHETISVTRPPAPKKESNAGGWTGVNSDEVHGPSGIQPGEEVVGDTIDSLAPRKPYPEMDSVGVVGEIPATTEETKVVQKEEDFPVNKRFPPNEKKSELFIDSGIFPFIAMGVLSALFITMMIAALYFARNSAGVAHHAQLLGMKQVGIGQLQRMAPPPGPGAFSTVTFRNTKDSVTGDFAVNMFAVRNDEREEAERMSSDVTESTMVPTFTAICNTPKMNVTVDSAQREAEHPTAAVVLHRDLPDVVSNPPSLCNSLVSNRHSTGSSLYMDLMNLSRNTRILEELAARKKTIRIRDPTQLELDCVLPDLSDYDCGESRRGRLQLCRQTSLDSVRCRDNLPLPCNYDPHYFKLYDADDDDSSAAWTSSATANTTLENILTSGDEGNSSTLNSSSLHRKGSAKRNSRLLDESRLLLPVQEFFNETMDDDGLDGDEVLYETIDEMGYRRRTASSRVMRNLMAAREEAGQPGQTVVVENAWENSLQQKKYDRIERGVKSLKKQSGKDYNSLVVKS